MTTKTITGAYPSGFTLKSNYSGLYLASTATVGGTGVFVTAQASVTNYGNIAATAGADAGIYLNFGGSVQNGGIFETAHISGYNGIKSSAGVPARGTVNTYGYIQGDHDGVQLDEGGTVANNGFITGGYRGVYTTGGAATVSNFGAITGGDQGVFLKDGGYLRNGGFGGSTALIEGDVGIYATAATVNNLATVDGYFSGVFLAAGARLTNGSATDRFALVKGETGVFTVGATSTIANYGTIEGTGGAHQVGVYLAGGLLTNGSGADQTALIEGYGGATATNAGTVTNFGTIQGAGPVAGAYGVVFTDGGRLANARGATIAGYGGVDMKAAAGTVLNYGTIRATAYFNAAGVALYGGVVKNGAVNDKGALIEGSRGINAAQAATVLNYGTIMGPDGGAYLAHGGRIVNGAATDTVATIEGDFGVLGRNAAVSVANFGTVQSYAGVEATVYLQGYGSTVTNGAAGDKSALIVGASGVSIGAAGASVDTVTNYATITGQSSTGVRLQGAGTVTNGGGADRSALIEGATTGVQAFGVATVRNFGTVTGAGYGYSGYGVHMLAGGTLANGSANNATALIEGDDSGIGLQGAFAVSNFGTIFGQGDGSGFGAELDGSGGLTNGAATHTDALITGYTGLYATAMTTITNFGTIDGAGGTAVTFGSSSDTLVVEAGSAFVGAVLGGGGTLDLASGTGTLTGNLAGGAVTVSGSMAATAFSSFNIVEIGAGATFAASGAVTVAAGQTIIDAGSLALGAAKAAVANAGTLETLGGTLTVKGAVTGAGQAVVDGGVLDFTSTFNQNVTFTGTGVLELAKSQTYAGTVTGFSKTGANQLDLVDIAFGGTTTAAYAGNTKSGTLTVTDGTHTAHIKLKGDYTGSTFVVASDGHGGTLVHDPAKAATLPSPQPFIAAMAALGAAGAGPVHVHGEPLRAPQPMLTGPRTALA
ncbi:MAG: beta strand repeat-containing protein [Caulobacteraceae bacterium]